jgi:1-acyl-sn-glycerol-3-phosphate acyltransferase
MSLRPQQGLGRVQSLWRCARALAHVLGGLWLIRRRFPHADWAAQQAHIQTWSQTMLAILSVSLEVRGTELAPKQGLVVANHLSWLDIVVMNAALPVQFVSKSDVKHWPVLGSLITGAGTLLIERASRKDAMRVVHHMAKFLRAGHRVAIFPEGTTHDGSAVLPFHANLIQAAISAESDITPVGLSYWDQGGEHKTPAPLFIGDMTLVASIWRTLRQGPVPARVQGGPSQSACGRSRRQWAHDLEGVVCALSQTPRSRAE